MLNYLHAALEQRGAHSGLNPGLGVRGEAAAAAAAAADAAADDDDGDDDGDVGQVGS